MSAQNMEALLARLYVDAAARASFRADPHGEARKAGLTEDECRSLENVDWVGVEMACSLAAKRQGKRTRSAWRHAFGRLLGAFPL
jgi:hypothetical protein